MLIDEIRKLLTFEPRLIVNADLNHRMELEIAFDGEATRVRKDGTLVAADEYDGKYILDSGECEVFSWKAEQ